MSADDRPIRLFVALPVAEAARPTLADSIAQVRARLSPTHEAALRWVSPEAFHVTLRFLGATEPARLEDVAAAVEAAAVGVRPFDAATGPIGLLGPRRSPTVVLQLTTGVEEVVRLDARLALALAARGWPRPERSIRPHLTIARGRSSRDARGAAAAVAGAGGLDRVSWPVERIAVIESQLGGGTPRYVERMSWVLRR
ncbi:MAG TPA: RNA 2',3'-cyclic phosphodiesterase [Candidatus Limnocylindrales bacterium]|nr:RNA 2',3'-cyclic phosphodiesterase [Candidatus Limnocylindrales bacterium]